MYRVPLSYAEINVSALTEVLNRYEGRSHQEIIKDFEKQVAELTGARFVVALNSGTAALHLALKALRVERDDIVIAPTFTYVATINPIIYQNAIPVLVDCESNSWNMNPELVEEAIKKSTKKPKAIIVVHNYGMPAEMEELQFLSAKYQIPLIEDAAEALGSQYKGIQVGTFGEIGILSFNNNKLVSTYGGGALITNNETIYRWAVLWASQAREDKLYYEHKEVGYNYRMGPLNAAAGLAKWPFLSDSVNKRRADFEEYYNTLTMHGFSFPVEKPGCYSNRWLSTTILPDGCSPIDLHMALMKKSIESRLLWNPMHQQPAFNRITIFSGEHSEKLFTKGLCLPTGKNLMVDHQHEIIETCVEIVKKGY